MELDPTLKRWATPRQSEYIDAINEHGGYAAAARALGIRRQSIAGAIKAVKKRAALQGWSPEHGMLHTAPEPFFVKGISTMHKTPEGNPQWVKTDVKREALLQAMREVVSDLCESLPTYAPREADMPISQKALSAYVIGDAHIGMFVKNERNHGQGDWDLDISRDTTLEAFHSLVSVGGGTDVGLIVDVGDFVHTPTSDNRTQSGHSLDVSGHFSDIVRTVVDIYLEMIQRALDAHREVVVMMVRGNHNADMANVINICLERMFVDEPRVTILNNDSRFMFYEYGNNIFGAHHGDKIKPQQVYEFFTRVKAKEWGRCDHRQMFMGHIHHHTAKQIGGLKLETFSTCAPTDSWHVDSGYGSERSMTCIVFDHQDGESVRHKYRVGMKNKA